MAQPESASSGLLEGLKSHTSFKVLGDNFPEVYTVQFPDGETADVQKLLLDRGFAGGSVVEDIPPPPPPEKVQSRKSQPPKTAKPSEAGPIEQRKNDPQPGSNVGGFLFMGLLVILAVVFYFLPSLIADQRGADHGTAIFVVNLLFGWTILGWIAALIWAVVEQKKRAVA